MRPASSRFFVIDLETGFERPIRREIENPLIELREVTRDATELVSSLRRTRGPNRQYLIRCLRSEPGRIQRNPGRGSCAGMCPPGVDIGEDSTSPVRPWQPFRDEVDRVPQRFYSRMIELMNEWDAWLQKLPYLAQARMIEWALVSRAILAMLAEAGVEAWVERRPITALRRLDSLEHRVVATQSL